MGKIRIKTFNYAQKKGKEWAKKIGKIKFMPIECYVASRNKKKRVKVGKK